MRKRNAFFRLFITCILENVLQTIQNAPVRLFWSARESIFRNHVHPFILPTIHTPKPQALVRQQRQSAQTCNAHIMRHYQTEQTCDFRAARIVNISTNNRARNVKVDYDVEASPKSLFLSAFHPPEKRSDIFRNMCLEF